MSAEAVVQRQLEAYNARDLDAFVAQYADGVELYRPPAAAPALVGRAALRDFYARERFVHDGLHADLLHRSVLGATVIDHERIHGVRRCSCVVVAATSTSRTSRKPARRSQPSIAAGLGMNQTLRIIA